MTKPTDDITLIEATTFEAPGSRPAAEPNRTQVHASLLQKRSNKWWHSELNLTLCVFGLLVIAVALFVFLSPKPSAVNPVVARESIAAAESASTSPSETDEAPWDDARRAQARVDSQGILSSLLNSKKKLEALGVKEWGNDDYQLALGLAQEGDRYYQDQNYQLAIEQYESAVEKINSLTSTFPQLLETLLNEGQTALDQGKSHLAGQKFNRALVLDPNNIPALSGLGRSTTLDETLEIFDEGQRYQAQFEIDDKKISLELAKGKYQQALALDKDYYQAAQALDTVSQLTSDKNYRDFMSTGFNRLFSKRYSSAKNAFLSALKVKPNDSTATSAYTQSLASDRSSSLSSLLSTAKKHEDNEAWSEAVSNYKVVLQRDPNQVSAKLGQIRAMVRSDLETRLLESLSDPLALAKGSKRRKAISALNDARGITQKGPRLEEQISQLGNALNQLEQTVKVFFSSDALTNVSLEKVGAKTIALGTFNTKKLVLKPGRYVVQGIRIGFHDVRQEVEILPSSEKQYSISIICTKPVGSNVSLIQERRVVFK